MTDTESHQDPSLLRWQLSYQSMSRAEVAKRAGVSQMTLGNLLDGTTTPQRRTLEKLAATLGVTIQEIAGETHGEAVIEDLAIHAQMNEASRVALVRVLNQIKVESHPWHGVITDERHQELWSRFETRATSRKVADRLAFPAEDRAEVRVETGDGDVIAIPESVIEGLFRRIHLEFVERTGTMLETAVTEALVSAAPRIVADVLAGMNHTPQAPGRSSAQQNDEPPSTVDISHDLEIAVVEEIAALFPPIELASALNESSSWFSTRASAVADALRKASIDPANARTWATTQIPPALVSDWQTGNDDSRDELAQRFSAAWANLAAEASSPW